VGNDSERGAVTAAANVVDGTFMPSIGAVNPTLTIITNAIRVAEHIASRLAS